MKKLIFTTIVLLLVSNQLSIGQKLSPIDYVDPFIGTSESRWMLYPGPSMPFGMVKLSPDNEPQKWKAGYDYAIENIAGFSHIHSWVTGGLLMMPTTGELKVNPGTYQEPDKGYRSRIDKSTEKASPGYYSVILEDYDIKVELTTTTRAGFHKYTFPKNEASRILIDLLTYTEYGYEVDWAYIKKVSDTEIEGFSKQKTYDHFSSLNNEYTVHFVMRFDKPFETFNTFLEYGATPSTADPNEFKGDIEYDTYEVHGRGDVGAFVEFETEENEVVQVKVGISLVSVEQARLNLDAELTIPFGWSFEETHQNARKEWNDLLSKIEIDGGTEKDKVKFYTNMYRSYAARTIWSDINGKYVDMCEQVVTLDDPDDPIYGCDAFWNTFWNLNQLWSLVTPDVTNSWVKSLLEIYDRGGWLPKGPTAIEYSSIMVASHEVALINSAYQKGIRNYDVAKAYEAIKHVMSEDGTAHPCGGLVGNRQLRPYKELGYVPHGKGTEKYHFGTKDEGPASNTLEYCYDDWNVAQMAKALGKKEDYKYFKDRAYNYKNIFHPTKKYMQPRLTNGEWVQEEIFSQAKDSYSSWSGKGFVEGNAWQYTWFVPHDVNGLVEMMGKDEFNNRLEEGFEKSLKDNFNAPEDKFGNVYVNHGNQPNMQAAYLFNYSGKPYLTQKWAREIMDNYYGDNPVNGWPGDEDQGQMGAWFVMSAIGLFQMDGGGATKPIYEIGSPLFEEVTIHLDEKFYSGEKFVIKANNVSKENRYIKSAKLNGKSLNKPWFYHKDLVKGGVLELEMSDRPNKKWGSKVKDAPPSMSTISR